MKIAIIGYGRMGKQIEIDALKSNIEIAAIIDNASDWEAKADNLKKADVAIEFTTPYAAVNNILKCFAMNLPVVSGTTGWDSDYEKVTQICEQQNQTLFTASNFSIGVQLFFRLNSYFARLINQFQEYEISVEEIHHNGKLDKPSGTALQITKRLLDEIDRKNEWTFNDAPSKNQIPVKSIRTGDVFGIHQVEYLSGNDSIQLKHTAFSRSGFARGALTAARWLKGKKGIFGMDDLLK
jgi:4-hydroxy-tetrahydrodipicolinate reductase